MANICIICKKEIKKDRESFPIREDKIIEWIRGIKQFLKVAQNNKLFVCKNDVAEHLKRRKQFEKDVVVYGMFALVIIVVLTGLPLMSGVLNIGVLLTSIAMGLVVFIFGALFKYVPAIEGKSQENIPVNENVAKKLSKK